MAESALFKKFQDEQAKKDAEYKAWEADQWKQHGALWKKEGYERLENSNSAWGSTWSKNPVINPPTNSSGDTQAGVETKPETKVETKAKTPKSFDLEAFRKNEGITSSNYITHEGNQYLRYDPDGIGDFYVGTDGSIYQANWFGGGLGDKLDYTVVNRDLRGNYLSNYNNLYNLISNFNVPTNKQGGTMNKVKYFQQGGVADIKEQIRPIVKAAMSPDKNQAEQAFAQIQQLVLKNPNLKPIIEAVIKEEQAQVTSAKWGSKLQYIRSLKFAKGGKTCPACMKDGGNTVKVAKKDVDTKTYQKQSFAKKAELDEHRLGTETSANKNGSYNTSHKPSAQDSTTIHRSTMSADMNKKYPRVKSKACGGTAPKAKKHYFGGWL